MERNWEFPGKPLLGFGVLSRHKPMFAHKPMVGQLPNNQANSSFCPSMHTKVFICVLFLFFNFLHLRDSRGVAEAPYWLRVLAALSEDWSSIPCTHIWGLTSNCNFCSKGISHPPLVFLSTQEYTSNKRENLF